MEILELLLILLVGIDALSVIEGRPSVTGRKSPDTAYLEVDQFLTSYGYYPSNGLFPDQEQNHSFKKHSDIERTKALKLFQKFFNLRQTGELDKETTQIMQIPRCGHADITSNLNTMATPAFFEMEDEEDVSEIFKEDENQETEESGVNVNREKRSLDTSTEKRVKRMSGKRINGTLERWRKIRLPLQWKITQPSKQKHLEKAQRQLVRKALATWEPILPFKFVENVQPKKLHMKIVFHSFAKSGWQDKEHDERGWRKQVLKESHGTFEEERTGSRRRFGDWYIQFKKTWKATFRGELTRANKWDWEELEKLNSARRLNRTKIERPKNAPKRKGSYAHAMVPTDGKELGSREIHLDEDYDWSNHEELLSVLLHEIGHSLGLGHTSDERAIMYPFNRDATQLAFSDIEGIENVYGSQHGRLQRPKCDARLREVDHVFWNPHIDHAHGTTYNAKPASYFVISGKKLQRVSILPELFVRNYRLYEMLFHNAPSKFDVVVPHIKSESIFFIAGNTLYDYYRPDFTAMPVKSYDELYFPETVKLALPVLREGRESVHLFGTIYRWTFEFTFKLWGSLNFEPLDDRSRQRVANSKFAVQWTDGLIYIVTRNGSWFSYNIDGYNRTDLMPGYPPWLEEILCSADSHAASIRMSRPSLVLVIILSLIKLY